MPIVQAEELPPLIEKLKSEGKKIVFTNGCFDLLHAGHAHYLNECKKLGDVLVVGINDDSSIRRLKGEKRPILPLEARAYLLASLRAVDLVVPFKEDTPIKLIEIVKPDVLVKGGDWSPERIVGADFVRSYGGRVVTVPFEFDLSTTKIVETIKERYCR